MKIIDFSLKTASVSLSVHSGLLVSYSIVAKHKELEGTSQASAEYQVLQIVSAMDNYGIEWHSVRDSEGQKLLIAVGPEGISICKDDFSPINRYPKS